MRVLFFGSLVEKVGVAELNIHSVNTLDGLKKYIFQAHPALAASVFAIAVNETIKTSDMPLKENDEVAFMPPFSGG